MEKEKTARDLILDAVEYDSMANQKTSYVFYRLSNGTFEMCPYNIGQETNTDEEYQIFISKIQRKDIDYTHIIFSVKNIDILIATILLYDLNIDGNNTDCKFSHKAHDVRMLSNGVLIYNIDIEVL